jgi:hypothetical protein
MLLSSRNLPSIVVELASQRSNFFRPISFVREEAKLKSYIRRIMTNSWYLCTIDEGLLLLLALCPPFRPSCLLGSQTRLVAAAEVWSERQPNSSDDGKG